MHKLTRRELEILELVSGGRSNRQVAEILWVADQTVKFHLANIYRKLNVRSRYEAARWARENGLLDVVVEPDTTIAARRHWERERLACAPPAPEPAAEIAEP